MGPSPAVADVRRAVRAVLADLPAGALVLVACSGGADSTVLAAATAFEAPRGGRRAGVVTVDHGLQDGSAQRALAVARHWRSAGLDPVEVLTVAVGRAGGPEAAARHARHAALLAAAQRTGAAAVLLGHTADDQAETVLLGLARGSGTRSLSGMREVVGVLRRPLLGLARSRVRAALGDHVDEVWEDPHNTDPSYARARVRHAALPALEAALGPGVGAALARSAGLLRADADALDGWATAALAAATSGEELAVAALEPLPRAVRWRVLRAWALGAGCAATDLTAGHVAALDALVTSWHGQVGIDLPGPVRAVRRGGRLALAAHRDPGGPPG